MDYKKLGMFLIIGLVISFSMSVVYKDMTITEFSSRLFITEMVEVILWCFVGKEK